MDPVGIAASVTDGVDEPVITLLRLALIVLTAVVKAPAAVTVAVIAAPAAADKPGEKVSPLKEP
jgi:hypothetical protein